MKITAKGIRYLEDNSKMKQMREHILESAGVITELVKARIQVSLKRTYKRKYRNRKTPVLFSLYKTRERDDHDITDR